MSRDQLIEEGNKLIAHAQALDNREKSMKLACQFRAKSIPKIAIANSMTRTIMLTGKITRPKD